MKVCPAGIGIADQATIHSQYRRHENPFLAQVGEETDRIRIAV
jgi:hypothetical protein